MPYPSNDKLPDDVKNALPGEAQNIWRNAFNSAIAKDPDEAGAARQAWGAIKNAGWSKEGDKWVKKNDRNDKSHSFDIEVMSVGTWNGDPFTEKDLEDMATNYITLKEVIKPPIKISHDGPLNKDFLKTMALGWVEKLFVKGDKLIASLVDVPDIIYRAIKARRFRRQSAEIYFGFKHAGKKFRRVLKAVTFLGADIPAVSNLADLEAYLSQSPGSGTFENVKAYSFETDQDGIIKTFITSEDDMDFEKEFKQLKKNFEDLETKLQDKDNESKEFKSKYEALKKENDEKKKADTFKDFETYLDGLVKEFKLLPASRDVLVKEDARIYSEEAGISISFETFKKFMETIGKVIDPKEVAKHEKKKDDPTFKDYGSEVDTKAREYAAKHKIDYGEAVTKILEANPELADNYADESKKNRDSEAD